MLVVVVRVIPLYVLEVFDVDAGDARCWRMLCINNASGVLMLPVVVMLLMLLHMVEVVLLQLLRTTATAARGGRCTPGQQSPGRSL